MGLEAIDSWTLPLLREKKKVADTLMVANVHGYYEVSLVHEETAKILLQRGFRVYQTSADKYSGRHNGNTIIVPHDKEPRKDMSSWWPVVLDNGRVVGFKPQE